MNYDILRPVRGLVDNIRADYKKAESGFSEGASHLAELKTPPNPTELLAHLGTFSNQTDGIQKNYSMPSVHIYQFPNYNATLHEARRTFSTSPHPNFNEWVAGLHIFATAQTGLLPDNLSDYWLAISVFRPQEQPYHLLESGDTERLDPKNLIEYYAKRDKWQKFHPDELPENFSHKINSALQRGSLF